MRSRRILAILIAVAAAAATAFVAARGADEGEILSRIKSDVFDQKWDSVRGLCDQFIRQYPSSSNVQRAFYYRAQAFEHTKGMEENAITAYTEYLTKFPGETGALREDAVLSRITLATTLYLRGSKEHVTWILKGMDEKGYTRIFAAIQASKIDHVPARSKAVPILKECATSEPDAEVKNECALALLRIDPKALAQVQPPSPPGPPKPPSPPGAPAPGEAKLIRVEVFDKIKKEISVRVNMPLAFAELLFQSLSEELRQEIGEGLQQKGIKLERFWDAFKKGGRQTIVEIDDERQHIKVWVE